jgi:hypothetical protein
LFHQFGEHFPFESATAMCAEAISGGDEELYATGRRSRPAEVASWHTARAAWTSLRVVPIFMCVNTYTV